MDFSKPEKDRYSRQVLLPQFGWEAQAKLKSASVLIVGVGGLGCPAALYLAAAGVGTIKLMDPDRVDLSNLHRQILFTEADVGSFKAEKAAERLKALNSRVQLLPMVEALNAANADVQVASVDLVIDCSDNFSTRYAVNDACVRQKKPLLSASVFQYEGQISLFNHAGGPCYRCLFPEKGSALSCAEAGVLGAIPGILGTMQAAEAVKALIGAGDSLSGRLLTLDAAEMKVREFRFEKRAECPCVTGKFPQEEAACAPVAPISVEELAGMRVDPALVLLDVRSREERDEQHLENDVWAALPELESGRVPPFQPGAKVVVYCASGMRSQRACVILKQLGINARSLQGGLQAWNRYF